MSTLPPIITQHPYANPTIQPSFQPDGNVAGGDGGGSPVIALPDGPQSAIQWGGSTDNDQHWGLQPPSGQAGKDDLLARIAELVDEILRDWGPQIMAALQGQRQAQPSADNFSDQSKGVIPANGRGDQHIAAPAKHVVTPTLGLTNDQGVRPLASEQTAQGQGSNGVGHDSPPTAGPSQGAPRLPVADGDVPGGDLKVLNLINDGDEPKTIRFTPNAGGTPVDDVILQPGESNAVIMPVGWSGNIRQTTGGSDTATLGEFTFGGKGENNFFDVSLIEGYNGGMVIQPRDGGQSSGVNENLLANAPDSIKAKDADGNFYGIDKALVANQYNDAVVNFYKNGIEGARITDDQAYVRANDDRSTLGTTTSQFDVHLY